MTRFAWLGMAVAGSLWFAIGGAGCGGKAVVDADLGNGGAASSNASNSASNSSSSSSSSSGGGCSSAEDCPDGTVCDFQSGQCLQTCNSADACTPCGAGLTCDDCATSSCPMCLDCVSACAPIPPGGLCDDHDDCGPNELCVYGLNECAPRCDAVGGCSDPNRVCSSCATSSCPCCRDCEDACLPF